MAIQVYPRDSKGYENLKTAARLLTEYSPNGHTFTVRETYFDFGRGWMWTTIIAEKPNGDTYQALYPRDHKKIIDAEYPSDIKDIVLEMLG